MDSSAKRFIMLIEDDPDDQEFFMYAIDQLEIPIPVVVELNCVNAIQYFKEFRPKPSAIFVDLNMPVMSGIEFLSELVILDDYKSVPVIILSSDVMQIGMAGKIGAWDIIEKPNDTHDLTDQVKNVLEQLEII